MTLEAAGAPSGAPKKNDESLLTRNRAGIITWGGFGAFLLFGGAFAAGGLFQVGHHLVTAVAFLAIGLALIAGGFVFYNKRTAAAAPAVCEKCGGALREKGAACEACAARARALEA